MNSSAGPSAPHRAFACAPASGAGGCFNQSFVASVYRMPSRRVEIELTEAERRELVDSERIVTVASFGPRGWPHLMPLWYVPRGDEIWVYTYAKSQKVRNLERDPRATLLIETGHEYGELRGVMIEAEAEIHRDIETVFDL